MQDINSIDSKKTTAHVEPKKRKNKCVPNGLTVDWFYIGALKELKDVANYIYKPLSKSLYLKLLSEDSIDDAKNIVYKFLDSISSNNDGDYLESSAIKELLYNAPIFKVLFIDNLNSNLAKVLKIYINKNNSREQRILFTIMDMSYFGNHTTAESAKRYLNKELKYFGYEPLNRYNVFDKIIISCINQEEKINKKNNLECKIGGLRVLSEMLNE